jgi:hypothetical protein
MFLSQFFPATTSEGKLVKIVHEIGKELHKALGGLMNYVEDIIPNANGVIRP